MKHCLGFLLFLLPVFALAQVPPSPGAEAWRRLDELKEWWTLGVDSTSESVDIPTFNKFKNLFRNDATITDAFSAGYSIGKDGRRAYVRDQVPKSFDVYAHDVTLQVKTIRVDRFDVLQADTANPQRMVFDIATGVTFRKPRKFVLPDDFARQVLASRPDITYDKGENEMVGHNRLNDFIEHTQDSMYVFSYSDTLRIVMVSDTGGPRIESITTRLANLQTLNDGDGDAVLDTEDSLSAKEKPGDFTAHGRPDYDLDGEPDATDRCRTTYGTGKLGCPPTYFVTRSRIDMFLGFQSHQQDIGLPELNQLGYVDAAGADAMDVLQSKKGALSQPGRLTGFFAGGNYAIFFGRRKKKTGVSIGLTYSKFAGNYEMTDPAVYTYKASDGVNLYRRQLSFRSLQEEISFTAINLPLLLNHRIKLGAADKTVLTLKAGPSFLFFKNVSNYAAVVDFGGLYQIDTVSRDRITWYDFFNEGSRYNLQLTSSRINSSNLPGPGADSVFSRLLAKGYDFAENKPFSGEQSLSRSAIAINVAADLQHRVSDGLTVKAGLHYVSAPNVKGTQRYKPVDKTTDEFQSVYNSNLKTKYSSIGLNVGFVFDF